MLKKYPLLAVLIVYAISYILLYPFYQYIFDVDGVGYLSVTRYLAAGNFEHGINGFWSPLHSWLAVPLFKAGINEFAAFRIINGLTGAGIIIVVKRLLAKINIENKLQLITLFVSIPITLSFVFSELSADILLCLLLLIYIDIITDKDFFENPVKNIAAGVVGCLCYFAKTYAFPFFVLHFSILQIVLYKRSLRPHKKYILLKNFLAGMGSFIILAAPWVYVLYSRYHVFTLGHVLIFGNSGHLNLSYYFHPVQSLSNEVIATPPSPLSCFWENPYYSLTERQQYYSSLFSFSLITSQVRTFLFNITIALKQLSTFSILSGAIILALLLYVLQKKETTFTIILLTIATYTGGYLLLHVEDRFLWPVFYIILITGIALSQKIIPLIPIKKTLLYLCWCIFFGSFLINVIDNLKDMKGRDALVFDLAKELQLKGVKGKLLSNNIDMAAKLAYLTGSTLCQPANLSYSYNELSDASRQAGINYFFYYYNSPQDAETFKNTAIYKTAIQEINTKMPNLLLLKMK